MLEDLDLLVRVRLDRRLPPAEVLREIDQPRVVHFLVDRLRLLRVRTMDREFVLEHFFFERQFRFSRRISRRGDDRLFRRRVVRVEPLIRDSRFFPPLLFRRVRD